MPTGTYHFSFSIQSNPACWSGALSPFELKLLEPLPSYPLEQLRQRFLYAVTGSYDTVMSARAAAQMAFETEIGAALAKLIELPPEVATSRVCPRRTFLAIDADMQRFSFLFGPALDAATFLPDSYVRLFRQHLGQPYAKYRVCATAALLCAATKYLVPMYPAPEAPTVNPQGTLGSTTYGYAGIAHYADGGTSKLSAEGLTTIGPVTLVHIDAVKAQQYIFSRHTLLYLEATVPGAAGNAITVAAYDDGQPQYATLDCGTLGAYKLDTKLQALAPGVAGNGITLTLTGDGVLSVTASLDCATLAAGNYDSVLQAFPTPPFQSWGLTQQIVLVGDSPSGVTVDVDGTWTVYTIHFEDGASTVGDVDAAISGLDPYTYYFQVKTGGTPGTVLHALSDNFPATNMIGGTDSTPPTIVGSPPQVVIHYATGDTVANIESIITNYLSDYFSIITPGTPGTVLTATTDDFAATNFEHGAEGVLVSVVRTGTDVVIHFWGWNHCRISDVAAAINALTGADHIIDAARYASSDYLNYRDVLGPTVMRFGADEVNDVNRVNFVFPPSAVFIEVLRITGGTGMLGTITAPSTYIDDAGGP